MDVTGTGQAAAAVATGVVTGGAAGAPAPTAAPDVDAVSNVITQGQQQSGAQNGARTGLAPAIAKLFGSATPPEPIRLNVSYRVLTNPNEIVTVFSDPKTGQEVAQFPPDILIGLAQFFDHQRGVTLDQDA